MDHNIQLFAQGQSLKRIGGPGLGPFGDKILNWDTATAGRSFANVISSIIGVFTIAAFVWFLIHILVAGLRWLESEGDKNKLEEAQNRLTNAFIGLIIVVAGWGILALASEFFGIPNILNPGELIKELNIQP